MSTPLSPGPERSRPSRFQLMFLILVGALVLPGLTHGSDAPSLVLTDAQTEYDLRACLELLDPRGADWSIDEVTTPPLSDAFQFAPYPRVPYRKPVWIRFRLTNTTSASRNWILEFSRPGGTHTLFYRDALGEPVAYHLSDTQAYNTRPLKRRTFAFPLSLQPGETRTYLMNVRSPIHWAPLALWTSDAYAEKEHLAGTLIGLYLGILLSLALYNGALFVYLRDEAYAWYVALLLLMILFAKIYFGTAQQYLWPDAAWTWGRYHVVFVVNGLITAVAARFVQIFLNTKTMSPAGHKLMGITIGCGLLNAVATLFATPVNTLGSVLQIFYGFTATLLAPVGILGLAIVIARRGYRPARFFLVAWSSMLVGGLITQLSDFQLIPNNALTMLPTFYIGNAVEVILLSFALGDRINILRREREEQEAAAIEAERVSRETREQSERKSAFLAAVAHELRTPMNAIKGFSNLVIRREQSLSDRGKENLNKVDRASDHLLATINDLLDLSKIEAGRMDVNATTFDVRQTILSACDVVSPLVQEGVELRHDIADDIGEANTDQQRLSQMLINLLSNAIKFTDQGSVTVTAAVDGASLAPPAPSAFRISVTDTGRGIPESELAALFDEYRQVEGQSESAVQRGTGLGLSITKRFAELLGGSITVESEVGAGSTFTVTIPLTYPDFEAEGARNQ